MTDHGFAAFNDTYIGIHNTRPYIRVRSHLGNKKGGRHMVRRFHRSIYDELDDLKASMDYLFQLAFEPMDNPMLPEGDQPDIVCIYPHNLNAEVVDHDNEVIVTVDMIPGCTNSKISVELISPDTLTITCDREEETTDNSARISFSLHHIVPLPVNVTTRGAASTYKNGVLDIHFKKAQPEKRYTGSR
jgi:HSP20 family molecular chaperone IbpA